MTAPVRPSGDREALRDDMWEVVVRVLRTRGCPGASGEAVDALLAAEGPVGVALAQAWDEGAAAPRMRGRKRGAGPAHGNPYRADRLESTDG